MKQLTLLLLGLLDSLVRLHVQPLPSDRATPASPPDSVWLAAGGNRYHASGFRRLLMGKNYRVAWQTPVQIPVFRANRLGGGLTATALTTDQQTIALVLTDTGGVNYVMRQVDKDPSRVIPAGLRDDQLLQDLLQDRISSAQPYAALVVPVLAQVLGIIHAEPRYYAVPEQNDLGQYSRLFGAKMVLFERQNPVPGTQLLSTEQLVSRQREHPGERVDERTVLRARLLDMLIGDGNRQDAYWQWIASGTDPVQYQPAPVNRDRAFLVNQGLLPRIMSRNWAKPSLQGFPELLRDPTTFNADACHVDRTFLTSLDGDAWENEIDFVRQHLTDSVLQVAIRQLPPAIRALEGERLLTGLQRRRQNLFHDAMTYYRFLAKSVDVVGSDGPDVFRITRRADNTTVVTVAQKNAETAPLPRYQRRFRNYETDEIRLYGLGGDDVFILDGQQTEGLLVRIIGGGGRDSVQDHSRVMGSWLRHAIVYTGPGQTCIASNRDIRRHVSADTARFQYNRLGFRYNWLKPFGSLQASSDDGLFLGASLTWRTQGFGHAPFATQHLLAVNHSFETKAYNVAYQGFFTQVLGDWGIQANAIVNAPNFDGAFYGFGNQTVRLSGLSEKYYRIRYTQFLVNALFRRDWSHWKFVAGPNYEHLQAEQTPDRYIARFASEQPEGDRIFQAKDNLGLLAGVVYDTRDRVALPGRGVFAHLDYRLLAPLNRQTSWFHQLHVEVSGYWSARPGSRLTVAGRLGTNLNLADYEFYQGSTLGGGISTANAALLYEPNTFNGQANLRGFVRNRFTGRHALFVNGELRYRLFALRTYLFPMSVGLLTFTDLGRVWQPGEVSTVWHVGYGGGLWLAPLQQVVLSASLGHSVTGNVPLVQLGFLF